MKTKKTKASVPQDSIQETSVRPVIADQFCVTGEQTVEEQIRQRAYELYESGGRREGRDLEDWLQAEAEVTNEKPRSR